jgi:hypothetical protein
MYRIKGKLKYLFIISFLCWLTQGCNIINPAETVPTYIHIDSFKFNASSTSHSSSHQISTVWAYYNGNPIGVFDLPADIPVMAKGAGLLSFAAGVAVSGLNSFPVKYPFYYSDTLTLWAQPGKTIVHVPETGYFSGTKFKVLANFDNTTAYTGFQLSGGSAPLTVTNNPGDLFEGQGSGVINLKAPNDTLSEDSTVVPFSIPLNVYSYIEVSYKNTAPFYLGMRVNLGTFAFYKTYLAGVFPSDHWQKFYFSLTDFAAQYKGDTYTFFIKSALDTGSSGKVLLDNIQLVTF